MGTGHGAPRPMGPIGPMVPMGGILFRRLLKPIPNPLDPTRVHIHGVVDFNELWVVDSNGLG